MLTEDEKNEFSEKEILRLTIEKTFKNQLNSQKTSLQKLFAFFNTSIGIFLLSTVFVSLGSWFYSQWIERKKITEECHKLESEISYRLGLILQSNRTLVGDEYLDIQNSTNGFNRQPPYNRVDLSAFPDLYEKNSIYTLSWQLYHYSGSKNNKLMFEAIEKYKKFMHDHAPKNAMTDRYQISINDSIYFEKQIKGPLIIWQQNL